MKLNFAAKQQEIFSRWRSLAAKPSFKFRAAAIGGAAVLGLCGVLLALSLVNSLFGLRFFPAALGGFFARSFGILALFIPLVLGYAGFILADPGWKPGRIFILGAGIFPFLTLAIGFAFIRDFEIRSQQFAFLDFAGKTGFGLAIAFITILEVLALRVIKNLMFPGNIAGGAPGENGNAGRRKKERSAQKHRPGLFLLPAPRPKLRDVYAESAAGLKGRDRSDNPALNRQEAERLAAERETIETLARAGDAGEIEELEELSEIDNLALLAHESVQKVLNPSARITPLADIDDNMADDRAAVIAPNVTAKHAQGLRNRPEVSIEQAIEEAEAAAAAHSEEVRKKAAAPYSRPSRKYKVPVEILNEYPDGEYWIIDEATREAAMILKETLEEFKIQAEVTGIRKGPVITMFEILPAPGVKLSRIVNLQDNIALRLAASSVRIVAPIPGKHAVGIEVPNAKRNIVSFREIIEGELRRSGKRPEIPVVMGKDITGEAQTVDLVQMPHLLIAGATGAGKSVCVNAMILSILYQLQPAECRLILIDPKIVELKLYNDIPHLLTPVITEPKRAFQALQWCIYEMERRYACLDSMGVRDIRNYNKRIKEKNIAQEHMPYIVIIIDEFADLMATTGKELESTLARLAAMSRAVGIHLVLATQRPSIDVITGLIKANIPSRIAFMVASKMDSRIIIDMVGAEKLLGKGDMLYAGAVDPFPIRMQGAFVSEEEVEAVVAHVKTFGEPDYIDDEIFYDEEDEELTPSLFGDGDDPLYDKALEIVMQQGKASASFIQRRLKIGYNRAARLVEEMEHKGVVGPAQGSKPRELLRGV
jgi:S-DNA-T family DNA segregation ATPase FtsK/SpoIIIE